MRILYLIMILSFCFADIPDSWQVTPSDYEYVFTVTAQLISDETITLNSSITIGAFIDNECRGVNTLSQVGENWLLFMVVYGNNFGEEIEFIFHNETTNSIHIIDETINFDPSGFAGTPDAPYLFHQAIDGLQGDLNQDSIINVLDIMIVVAIILGAEQTVYQQWAGDIYEDSIINVIDIVTIVNIILY